MRRPRGIITRDAVSGRRLLVDGASGGPNVAELSCDLSQQGVEHVLMFCEGDIPDLHYQAGATPSMLASVSGGKDSAAMSLWLTEQGFEHVRVFLDTGWEHQQTYDYLRGPLAQKLGPIIELRLVVGLRPADRKRIERAIADLPLVSNAYEQGSPMVLMALKKGMFPAGKSRWCTEYLKEQPIKRLIETAIDSGVDLVNAVGIRAAESRSRSTYAERTELKWARADGRSYDCEMWRPILRWSLDDVVSIHERHGLRPNPLYLIPGIERVGCFCIRARKAEIRATAERMPQRIELVRQLEAAVGRLAAERLGRTEIRNPSRRAPGWFQAPVGPDGACWPIDKVVAWSRTSRGGKQFELFAPTASEGCMRWGLCEPPPPMTPERESP